MPILAVVLLRADRARRRSLAAFAGRGAALVSRRLAARRIRGAVGLVALLLVTLALGGPRIGTTERQVLQQGADIVVAVDVSQSMAATDVSPDRLHAARGAIEQLAARVSGSRVALVLFAGDAVARYPVTRDVEAIVQALDNSGRGFKPNAGSSLKAGVESSLAAFPPASDARRRAVLIISDGGDAGAELPDAASILQRGVRLFTLGVGTAAGGVVPTYDLSGRPTGVLRGANGQPLVSRLEETGLRRLADAGGGRYWQYLGNDAPISELATELRSLDVSEVSAEKVPADRFQWLLALALVLLVADLAIDERRRMPSLQVPAGART